MIRYDILAKSQEHYEARGYIVIEVPWTVPNPIVNITYYIEKKDNEFFLHHKDKSLVASGEQGFLALYNKGFLPKGNFQTITPCFRDETFDETHTKYFMKNELIITDIQDTIDQLNIIVTDAYSFFIDYVRDKDHLKIIQLGDFAYDICYKGIELGSYGYRECSFLKWIYGTGVAEPRFSRTIDE